MEIRDAVAEDAPAACQVLRRSIVELCVADRGNDPTIMMRWLSNKTPDIVASWIASPENSLLVAAERGTILGGRWTRGQQVRNACELRDVEASDGGARV